MTKNEEIKLLSRFNYFIMNRETDDLYEFIESNAEICSAKLLNNIGWFYMTVGEINNNKLNKQYIKAVDFFERALMYNTADKSHYIYTNLGEAYIRLHNYSKAQEILLNSIKVSHSIVNQNNLAYCFYMNGLYDEAEDVLDCLKSEIQGYNMFDIINKSMYSLNSMSMFMLFYNFSCIKWMLNKKNDIKEIFDILIKYYHKNLIDIEDVDILDIVYVAYMCDKYEKVVELFPKHGYVIDDISFGIYISSMLHLNRDPRTYYDEIIKEYIDEYEEIENNAAKKELKERIHKIKTIYDQLLNNNNIKIEAFPRIMSSRYIFFE